MPHVFFNDLMLATQPGGGALSWIEIALVIFFVVFLAIVIWVILARPGRFRKAARIPLEDDRVVTPRESADSEECI